MALSILVFVFTLGFVQISKVDSSLNPALVYKAHLCANRLFSASYKVDEEHLVFEEEGMVIEKTTKKLDFQLYQLDIVISTHSGRILLQKRCLINYEILL